MQLPMTRAPQAVIHLHRDYQRPVRMLPRGRGAADKDHVTCNTEVLGIQIIQPEIRWDCGTFKGNVLGLQAHAGVEYNPSLPWSNGVMESREIVTGVSRESTGTEAVSAPGITCVSLEGLYWHLPSRMLRSPIGVPSVKYVCSTKNSTPCIIIATGPCELSQGFVVCHVPLPAHGLAV